MKRKALLLSAILSCIPLLFASTVFSDIQSSHINQSIGFDDTIFKNQLEAASCVYQNDPVFVSSTHIVNSHHLMFRSPFPQGECSVNSNGCHPDDPDTTEIYFLIITDCLHYYSWYLVKAHSITCSGPLTVNALYGSTTY